MFSKVFPALLAALVLVPVASAKTAPGYKIGIKAVKAGSFAEWTFSLRSTNVRDGQGASLVISSCNSFSYQLPVNPGHRYMDGRTEYLFHRGNTLHWEMVGVSPYGFNQPRQLTLKFRLPQGQASLCLRAQARAFATEDMASAQRRLSLR